MPIERLELRDAARTAIDGNKHRRIASAFCSSIAAALDDPKSRLWAVVEEGWKARYFQSTGVALGQLMAAIHFEALRGEAKALAAQFPTCGGQPTNDLPHLIGEFLLSPPPGLGRTLAERTPRHFNPWLCIQWMNFAQTFFQKRKMGYHVVEFNTAGGLGAAVDVRDKPDGFDSRLIEARLGLDERCLDVRRDEDAQWLIACNMPDDGVQVSQTAISTNRLREALRSDKEFLQTADCPSHLQPAFVTKNIPVEDDLGLLAFGMRVGAEMREEHRKDWIEASRQMMAAWQGRALWVQFENKPGRDGAIFLHRYRDGKLASYEAMTFFDSGEAAKILADIDGIAAFLA